MRGVSLTALCLLGVSLGISGCSGSTTKEARVKVEQICRTSNLELARQAERFNRAEAEGDLPAMAEVLKRSSATIYKAQSEMKSYSLPREDWPMYRKNLGRIAQSYDKASLALAGGKQEEALSLILGARKIQAEQSELARRAGLKGCAKRPGERP